MNERGIALPMALLVMLVLLVLLGSLASVTTSEPPIAINHVVSSQARALAESGLGRAAWALSSGALADPLPDPMPGEYTGAVFLALGRLGGFTLEIAPGATAYERVATSTGWVPHRAAPRAVRKVRATLARLRWLDPPCALCAGGESPPATAGQVRLTGHARVDASTRAGAAASCSAGPLLAAVMSTGAVTSEPSTSVIGPRGGDAVLPAMPRDAFGRFTFTDDDLAVLKAVAREHGAYSQGTRAWADAPPPPGLVFVDTASTGRFGQTTPAADAARVELSGDFAWSGWLIVAGSIHITGNSRITGLVYALGDVVVGPGAAVVGAVIAANRRGAVETRVESGTRTTSITYDCEAARDGGGTVSQRWFVKPGSYREMAGS